MNWRSCVAVLWTCAAVGISATGCGKDEVAHNPTPPAAAVPTVAFPPAAAAPPTTQPLPPVAEWFDAETDEKRAPSQPEPSTPAPSETPFSKSLTKLGDTPKEFFESPEQKSALFAAVNAMEDEDWPRAIALATEGLRLTSAADVRGKIQGLRGIARLRRDDYAGALADSTPAIAAHPDQAKFRYHRAIVHYTNKDYGLAIEDCDAAIRLDPTAVVAYQYRAACRIMLRELAAALTDIDRLLELDPDDAAARARQGEIRERLVQAAAAEPDGRLHGRTTVGFDFESAAGSKMPVPEMPIPDAERLAAFAMTEAFSKEDWPRVIRICSEEIPKSSGEMRSVWYGCRGIARWQSDDLAGAVEDCSRSLELAPSPPLRVYRAVVEQQRHNYGRALADLDEAIRVEPENGPLYFMRYTVRAARGEDEQAMADLNRVVELMPNDPRALLGRGAACRESSPEQAVKDATAALAIEPDNTQALLLRARAYQDLGRDAESKADVAAAEKLEKR